MTHRTAPSANHSAALIAKPAPLNPGGMPAPTAAPAMPKRNIAMTMDAAGRCISTPRPIPPRHPIAPPAMILKWQTSWHP